MHHITYSLVTVFLALMMFSQGIILISYDQSGGGASLSALVWVCQGSTDIAGLVLIFTTILTFVAYIDKFLIRLLVPQLLVGLVYASGSINSIITGTYADKYVPAGGALFIYNDQVGWIVLFAIHSIFVALQLM